MFAADPLLYTVEKDPAGSAFHANPALLEEQSVSSATDLVPLMQEMIDGQEPVIEDIRLRDPTAVQHDLAVSAYRWDSLEWTVISLDLNGGEIDSFLPLLRIRICMLSELMNQTAAFDTVQRVGAREENRNNQKLQASVASQGALLMKSIRELADRYADDHETVPEISTGLGLDTSRYTETLVKVKGFIDEIEGKELPVAEPASFAGRRHHLLYRPRAGYLPDNRSRSLGLSPHRERNGGCPSFSMTPVSRPPTATCRGTIAPHTPSSGSGQAQHILAASTGNITSEQRELVSRRDRFRNRAHRYPGHSQ